MTLTLHNDVSSSHGNNVTASHYNNVSSSYDDNVSLSHDNKLPSSQCALCVVVTSATDCQSPQLLLQGPEKAPRLRDSLHLHLPGLLGAGSGLWAVRAIGAERSDRPVV